MVVNKLLGNMQDGKETFGEKLGENEPKPNF